MKWIFRIVTGLLVLVVLAVVGVGALIAGDGILGKKAADYSNASFTAMDGAQVVGYLARPEGSGPFPAVLMVHEWWGLNGEITEMADLLAEQGYVVFAPDTYRGGTTSLVPRALFLRITTPESRVDSDMQAAYDFLASQQDIDPFNIGVMGFCYGGGVALRHAVINREIAATINLYGEPVVDPAAFGALLEPDAGPVLGIFGEADMQIPVQEANQFDAAMDSAGIINTVTIYPQMPHAFVNPSGIDAGGAPREAWNQILAFFNQHLKSA